jgi:serine protease Do
MRKSILLIIVLTGLAVLAACAAGMRQPKPQADLGEYKFVILHEAGDLGGELGSTFSGLGFDVRQASAPEDKAQTLVLSLQHLTASGKTRAKVRLYELASGREIYVGQASSEGEAYPESVLKAARAALLGFYEQYKAPSPDMGLLVAEKVVGSAKSAPIEDSAPAVTVSSDADKDAQGLERMTRDEQDLKKYFDSRGKDLVEVEGIWANQKLGYSLAIFLDKQEGKREFAGMYLKGGDKNFKPGDVVLDIAAKAGQAYPAVFRGPSGSEFKGSFSLKSGELVGMFKDSQGKELKMAFVREYPASAQPSKPKPSLGSTVGSGFLLSNMGLIATNHHVIRNAVDVSVSFPKLGKRFEAEILMKDERNDLAILRLRGAEEFLGKLGPLPYHLARPNEVRLGQDIVTMGFPLGSELGESHKITTGVVSSLNGVRGEPGRMQISNSIQPGNSGGPVFNHKGQVVGVVVGALDDEYYLQKKGFVPQNVNFAVKIGYLHSMVDLIPDAGQCKIRPAKVQAPANLEQLVQDYSPYVVMIRSKTLPKS